MTASRTDYYNEVRKQWPINSTFQSHSLPNLGFWWPRTVLTWYVRVNRQFLSFPSFIWLCNPSSVSPFLSSEVLESHTHAPCPAPLVSLVLKLLQFFFGPIKPISLEKLSFFLTSLVPCQRILTFIIYKYTSNISEWITVFCNTRLFAFSISIWQGCFFLPRR